MYYYEYFTEVQVEPTVSEITKIFEDNKSLLFIDILEKIWSLNASKQIKGFGKHEIETIINADTVNTANKLPSDITVQDYHLMKIKIVSQEPSSRPVIYNKPIGPITMIGPINIFYLNSNLNNNTIFNLEFKKNNTKLTPQLDYILDTLKKSKGVIYINDVDIGPLNIEDLDHQVEVLILDNININNINNIKKRDKVYKEPKVYIKNKYRLTLIVLNSNIKVEFIYQNPETACPKTECPKTECPKTECPKTECPKTECPVEQNYTVLFVFLFLIILISVGFNIYSVLFSKNNQK